MNPKLVSVINPSVKKLREVYVLSGATDAGKTTTLNQLAYLVSQLSTSAQIDGPTPAAFGLIGNRNDTQYCYSVAKGGKKITVGISTKGDGSKEIAEGFKYFNTHNCDVCFIASKQHGLSIEQLEETAFVWNFVPRYCYLINEYCKRSQSAIEQAAATFLLSFVQ